MNDIKDLLFPNQALSEEGRDFRNDDLLALQEKLISLEEVAANFGAYIVSGCTVSGTAPSNDISEGIVVIDGRLRYFAAVTGVDLSTPQYIIAAADSPNNPRPLASGGTQNALSDKLASLSASPATPPLQSIEISETGGRDSALWQGEWQDLVFRFTGSPTSVSQDVQYRKDVFGYVRFRGSIKFTSNVAIGGQSTVIPAGFIPAQNTFGVTYQKWVNNNAIGDFSLRFINGYFLFEGDMNAADVPTRIIDLSWLSYYPES